MVGWGASSHTTGTCKAEAWTAHTGLLLAPAACSKAVHVLQKLAGSSAYLLGLPDTMTTCNGLFLVLGVWVRVIDDDSVRGLKVQTPTSSTDRQQEYEHICTTDKQQQLVLEGDIYIPSWSVVSPTSWVLQRMHNEQQAAADRKLQQWARGLMKCASSKQQQHRCSPLPGLLNSWMAASLCSRLVAPSMRLLCMYTFSPLPSGLSTCATAAALHHSLSWKAQGLFGTKVLSEARVRNRKSYGSGLASAI